MPLIPTHANQLPLLPHIFKEHYKGKNKYCTIKLKLYLFDMASGETFIALRDYFKKRINKWQLEDADPMIDYVRENDNNLGQSVITINFGSNDGILKSLGLHEDDIWFYRAVSSPYNDFEFIDYHRVEEDYDEGYGIWYELNDDNKELLRQISKHVYPYDSEENIFDAGFAKFLKETFPKEMERIFYDYMYERNSASQRTAIDEMDKEIKELLSDSEFDFISTDKLKTTVADLTSLYLQYNVPHEDLDGLFKEVFQGEEKNIGGWYEDQYQFDTGENFDTESFNRSVDKEFSSIMEKIENDESEEFKKFLENVKEITKKFKHDRWYSLPKNNNYKFRIKGYDKETSKIVVELSKQFPKTRTIKISIQNFYNLLYQPELFEFGDLYNL